MATVAAPLDLGARHEVEVVATSNPDSALLLLQALAQELVAQGHLASNLLCDEEGTWMLEDLLKAMSSPVDAGGQVVVRPLLPPSDRPHLKTLVLDIDGTLITSLFQHETTPAHSAPAFVWQTKNVWLRPGVRSFLQAVRPFFEVAVFTAATPDWADRILQELDPTGELIDHRLYRQHTTATPAWAYVKDLSRLGRDLRHVTIVDDNQLMFALQPTNAIWVHEYNALNPHDDVLDQALQVLLLMVLPAVDVTTGLSHLLGLKIMPQQSHVLQLVLAASEQALDAAKAASAGGLLDAAPVCGQPRGAEGVVSTVSHPIEVGAEAEEANLAALLQALGAAAALPLSEQLAMACTVVSAGAPVLAAAAVKVPAAEQAAAEGDDGATTAKAPVFNAASAAANAPENAAVAAAGSAAEAPAIAVGAPTDVPAIAAEVSATLPAAAATPDPAPLPAVARTPVRSGTRLKLFGTPLSPHAVQSAVAAAVAIAAAAVRSPSLKRRRSLSDDQHASCLIEAVSVGITTRGLALEALTPIAILAASAE